MADNSTAAAAAVAVPAAAAAAADSRYHQPVQGGQWTCQGLGGRILARGK